MMVPLHLTCPKCDGEVFILKVDHDTESMAFQVNCTNPECGIPSVLAASYQDLIILAHSVQANRPVMAYRPSHYIN